MLRSLHCCWFVLLVRMQDCVVFLQSVYSAAHISRIASKPPQSRSYLEVSKLASELTRVPLLATLDTQSLRKLAEEVQLEVHLPGSLIMRQGDFGDRMFLLTEGSVSVMKLPEEELTIIRNFGTWADSVEPLLKDSAQVNPLPLLNHCLC
jgi:hypothetical protein